MAHFDLDRRQARSGSLAGLEAVKIKDPERVYRSFPHQLSGGMKQRVMIAMALAMKPALLVADEPTTALDANTESEIMKLLAFLREGGMTILFITHNLSLAASFSKTIYVMEKGAVVERMEKIQDGFSPVKGYTQKLFNANLMGLTPKSPIPV